MIPSNDGIIIWNMTMRAALEKDYKDPESMKATGLPIA
jgi:hypothetical protein